MFRQDSLCHKSGPTNIALVSFVANMTSFMQYPMGGLCERALAKLAREWALPCVDPCVLFKEILGVKCLMANCTLEWLETCVPRSRVQV